MIRKVVALAAVVAAPLTAVVQTQPAMASGGGVTYQTIQCSQGQRSKAVTVGGHTGYLKCGTNLFYADTDGNGSRNEAYGISPGGRVYHAWLGGPGWVPLQNGRLTNIYYVSVTYGGQRTVCGYLNGSGYWFAKYFSTEGGWFKKWLRRDDCSY